MAQVRQWITGFFKRHRAKFNPHDWPDGSDAEDSREFLLTWVTAFATREVSEAEADEASRALGPTPPNFRREHLPAVLGMIEASRQRRGVRPGEGTREAVRDASRGCGYCGGEGLAVAWSEAPDLARKVPETVAAYCVCGSGRWVKKAHAEKFPELLRRIPDFGEVLDGCRPGWLDHPPGRPELSLCNHDHNETPEPAPAAGPTRADVAAMFKAPY